MSKLVSPNIKDQASQLVQADYDRKSRLDSFASVKKVTDPRFGPSNIIRDPKTNEVFICQEHKFSDQKSLAPLILEARERLKLSHPNIAPLVDYSVNKESELCSTFYHIKLYFEYPKNDLKKESLDRKSKGEKFSASELRNIYNQQASALKYLEDNNRFHGDVQPLMIGYNKDKAETKLIPNLELTKEDHVKTHLKNRFVKNENLYATPQTFNSLASGTTKFDLNTNKEDKYNLGLSILELANQRHLSDIYNKSTKSFDNNALQTHLTDMGKEYGVQGSDLALHMMDLTNVGERNQSLHQNISTTVIGQDLHTIVQTKQTLAVKGVNLFDNIPEDLHKSELAKPRTEQKAFASAPVEDAPQNQVVTTTTTHVFTDPNKKEVVNLGDDSTHKNLLIYNPQSTDGTTTTQNVVYTSSNPTYHYVYSQPSYSYNQGSYTPVSYTTTEHNSTPFTSSDTNANVYTNSFVPAEHQVTSYSYTPQTNNNVVYSSPDTQPTTIFSGITQTTVIHKDDDVSGLKLVGSYQDHSLVTNNKNY